MFLQYFELKMNKRALPLQSIYVIFHFPYTYGDKNGWLFKVEK